MRSATPGQVRVLESVGDLDAAVQGSHERPIVIFKHSASCGTSLMAEEEIQAFAASTLAVDVFVVSVQSARPVSNEIAARFGVRHESPQALVIRDGAVRWHGSHFRVRQNKIAEALA